MTNEEIIAILESYKSFEDNRSEELLHHGYDNTKASRKRKEALDEAIKALSENKGENKGETYGEITNFYLNGLVETYKRMGYTITEISITEKNLLSPIIYEFEEKV